MKDKALKEAMNKLPPIARDWRHLRCTVRVFAQGEMFDFSRQLTRTGGLRWYLMSRTPEDRS